MSEWKECTIGELCSNICSGGTPNRSNDSFCNNGNIPWLNTKEVSFNRIYQTENFITELGLKNSAAKWIPQNTVVVAMYGATAGKSAIVKIPVTTNQACCNLTIDGTKADYRFVYYSLFNRYEHLASLANGGAQQNLNAGLIREFKIKVPELETQTKIADILSSLDDKIELNNQINRNLEEQAQAIFKSWFIDFEPFGGEMPENWEIGKIGDLVERTINGDWGKDEPMGTNTEEVFCIRGADIPEVKKGNKGKMPTRYILPKNYQQKKLEDGDLVVEISGGSPTQSTGRAAYISDALLERYNNKIVCTNFCKAIKFKNNYSTYMYFYWIYLYDKGIFFSYENGTTGIKNLDVSGILENEEIIIPSIDFLSKFNAYCSAAFKRISANGAETEQLGILRDSLLPKLMSGEIDLGR